MAQFSRPSADLLVSSWTNEGGSSVDLYQSIDEITPSDVDYVESEQILSDVYAFPSTILVIQLGPVTDPDSDTGFVLRVRASKDLVNGREMDLTVELRQNYLHETDLGLLITTLQIFNLTEVPVDYSVNLTEAEAALITDFSALSLRFIGSIGVV